MNVYRWLWLSYFALGCMAVAPTLEQSEKSTECSAACEPCRVALGSPGRVGHAAEAASGFCDQDLVCRASFVPPAECVDETVAELTQLRTEVYTRDFLFWLGITPRPNQELHCRFEGEVPPGMSRAVHATLDCWDYRAERSQDNRRLAWALRLEAPLGATSGALRLTGGHVVVDVGQEPTLYPETLSEEGTWTSSEEGLVLQLPLAWSSRALAGELGPAADFPGEIRLPNPVAGGSSGARAMEGTFDATLEAWRGASTEEAPDLTLACQLETFEVHTSSDSDVGRGLVDLRCDGFSATGELFEIDGQTHFTLTTDRRRDIFPHARGYEWRGPQPSGESVFDLVRLEDTGEELAHLRLSATF